MRVGFGDELLISTMATIHAHWDCSKGLSLPAILAASLTATAVRAEALERAHALQVKILPLVFGGFMTHCKLQLVQDGANADSLVYEIGFVEPVAYKHMDDLFARCDGISKWVSETVRAVLRELYSKPGEETLGAVEAKEMALATGAIWALDRLSVKTVTCSPIPFAISTANCPIPIGLPVQVTEKEAAPFASASALAVLRVILRVCPSGTNCTAPAMILHTLAHGASDSPVQHQTSLALGERCDGVQSKSRDWNVDEMIVLEANLDDCTPEHLSFCVDRLLLEGAADAWITPIVMKKGRAAHTLSCLARTEQKDKLLRVLFRHSTTLGVRAQNIERAALRREILSVQTKWEDSNCKGIVSVKVGYLGAEVVSIKAEFDDCRQISLASGVSVQLIADEAVRIAREHLEVSLREGS